MLVDGGVVYGRDFILQGNFAEYLDASGCLSQTFKVKKHSIVFSHIPFGWSVLVAKPISDDQLCWLNSVVAWGQGGGGECQRAI